MDATARVGTGIQPEEKVRALEIVLQSETFARSGRLRDLLRFVCEAEIAGRESELTEYTIGTAALGRPADFSPLEDSSVRSRTYELRQKLEKFYAQECPSARVRIELRKGSYAPRFLVAREDADEPEHLPVFSRDVPPLPIRSNRSTRYWFLALAFVAGAAASLVFARMTSAVAQNKRVNGWTPELETVWRPFIDTATPTLIVVETRFFVRMGSLIVRDWNVDTLGNVERSEPLMRVKRLFGIQQLYGTSHYTDAGNPRALFYLTRLLSSRVPNLTVKSSLEATADDFRNSNIVMLGKPWMDPQVERVLSRGELIDANGKILNLHPRPGELPEYRNQGDPKDPERWSEQYSVISMIPGVSGDRRILTLTSSGSEHPAALAYYLTNPETVRELYRKMQLGAGKAAGFFQVLVRAEFKSISEVRVEYVTSRPVPRN
jgi:hypothetical protein